MRASAGGSPLQAWPSGSGSAVPLWFVSNAGTPMSRWESSRQFCLFSACTSVWPIWRMPVRIGSAWIWRPNPYQSESTARERNGLRQKIPMNREIEVYVDLDGQTHLVGRLWSRLSKGLEGASFGYDAAWLASPLRFPLEPALSLDTGSHHTGQGHSLFGGLGDSSPDRWGRMLMKRMERRIARREGRAPRALMEIDYLLMVDDAVRPGALRFKEAGSERFLASGGSRIPPLVYLSKLLAASDR